MLHYLLDFCCNEERACRTFAAKLCRRWVGLASNWNQQCCVCVCVCVTLSLPMQYPLTLNYTKFLWMSNQFMKLVLVHCSDCVWVCVRNLMISGKEKMKGTHTSTIVSTSIYATLLALLPLFSPSFFFFFNQSHFVLVCCQSSASMASH